MPIWIEATLWAKMADVWREKLAQGDQLVAQGEIVENDMRTNPETGKTSLTLKMRVNRIWLPKREAAEQGNGQASLEQAGPLTASPGAEGW